MLASPAISGEHKTLLSLELLHAGIVVVVVLAATAIYFISPSRLPSDLLGFVYGGAITYAGGRASQSRQAFARKSDRTEANNG